MTATRAHGTERQRGFTLVEMLVALSLAALLMVGIAAALRTMIEAEGRQAALLASAGRVEAVDRAIRSMVEGATGGFAGDGGKLSFEGVLPLSAADHLRRARIEIAAEGDRLVARWTALLRDGEGREVRGKVTLVEGVEDVAFLFLESEGAAGPPVWSPRLQGGETPRLIRLRLKMAGSEAPRWPDIVVAPKVRETQSPRNK